MTDEPMIQLGQLLERADRAEDAVTDLTHRVIALEQRPSPSADACTWADAEQQKAAARAAKRAARRTFIRNERTTVLGLVCTLPASALVGFVLGQVLPHLHLHLH